MANSSTRPHEVHLRLNEEEYRALEKNRAKCRLTQQAYLRMMCEDIQPKEQPHLDFFRVLNELRRIGNNLNQIAAVAHKDRWMDADLYWENAKQLQQTVSSLMEQIYS